MPPCFPNYASPDQNNFVKSVIDTYENTGPMHLSHKYPVEGGRENFSICSIQQKQQQKRSDFITTAHAYTEKGDRCPLDCHPDRTGQEHVSYRIVFAMAVIIQAAPRALTALKLHLSYILNSVAMCLAEFI